MTFYQSIMLSVAFGISMGMLVSMYAVLIKAFFEKLREKRQRRARKQ